MNNNTIEQWIVEADITAMQAAMESGEATSEAIVQAYLERISQYDPKLKSILEINPDALDIARSMDEERRLKGSRGSLHGIPIVLKDNIDTGDQMHTSAGSVTLADSFAAEDSSVAAALRSAGAVILGKANMTEWANFMSNTMWSGYSSRGGLVLNPYGPGELFVGGSSSGSAVAVAANLAAVTIGTETSGSIISPASQNCVVGIKPTVGLISRRGIIPLTYTQDTAGPIARTVRDAAIVLGALTGVDERDEVTVTSNRIAYTDYTPFLDATYLQQARIGIPRYYYQDLDSDRLEIMETAISILKEAGVTIVDFVELPCEGYERNGNVLRYEFKKYVNDYLAQLPPSIPVHSLKDVIDYNEQHSEVALKYGQDVLLWAEDTSGTLTEQEYINSKVTNFEMSREQGIDYVLTKYNLDALMSAGCSDLVDLAAIAGYPSITVPAGYAADGIVAPGGYITNGPLGVTFTGTAYSEGTLIKLAYGFEQLTKFRYAPELD